MLWYCFWNKISTSRHRGKNNFQMKEIFWLKCKLSRHSPIPRKTFQLILRLNQRLIAGWLWNIISKYFQTFPNISNIKIPGSFYLLSLLNIPEISILYQLSLWRRRRLFGNVDRKCFTKTFINLIKAVRDV